MKPTLTGFTQLAEMMIQTYERYLPTAYDENMSLLQKVNKVIYYLNETGKLTNEVVSQWNELMEWVLNDGLEESIVTRLDEMVLDGTLDNIINQTIFSEINTRLNDLAISVKSYGAKGDGVTDDTQAFKDAISYAIANDKKLVIPFTDQEYLITDTIYSADGSPNIEGVGGYPKIRFKPGVIKKPFLWLTGVDPIRTTIKDIEVIGDETTGSRVGIFLKVEGALRYGNFENVILSYLDTCFELNGEVSTTRFTNCRSIATEYHMYCPNVSGELGFNNVSFHNCNFRSTTYAFYMKNLCNNVSFYDCIFDIKDRSNTDGRGGIYFTSPRNVQIVGGYIEARHQSVFEFDLSALGDTGYDYPVTLSNVYIRNYISDTGIRDSFGIKAKGRIGLTVERCYFNGWNVAIDYTDGTGTFIEDSNSFANVNTSFTKSATTGLFLNQLRGVVEHGSNSNGFYIRYADGTQICQAVITSLTTGATEWIFPIRFLTSTSMSINANVHSGSASVLSCVNVASRAFDRMTFNALWLNGSVVERLGTSVSLTAVGRWK